MVSSINYLVILLANREHFLLQGRHHFILCIYLLQRSPKRYRRTRRTKSKYKWPSDLIARFKSRRHQTQWNGRGGIRYRGLLGKRSILCCGRRRGRFWCLTHGLNVLDNISRSRSRVRRNLDSRCGRLTAPFIRCSCSGGHVARSKRNRHRGTLDMRHMFFGVGRKPECDSLCGDIARHRGGFDCVVAWHPGRAAGRGRGR